MNTRFPANSLTNQTAQATAIPAMAIEYFILALFAPVSTRLLLHHLTQDLQPPATGRLEAG